jgi:hypothetical protein
MDARVTVEQLLRAGGKQWQKNGMDRVYVNDLSTWYGLDVSRYGSGNISSATLRGESCSNAEAKRLIEALDLNTKLWLDVAAGTWAYKTYTLVGRYNVAAIVAEIVAAIETKIAETEPAAA